MRNVIFDKAVAFDNAGKSVEMNNVTINETHDYYALWICAAGVALVSLMNGLCNFTSRIGNFFRRTEFYLVDHGIACEHFVLRAHDLGLGTCWIGWLNSNKAEKFFNLPKGKKIEHLIAVGYPAEEPTPRPRESFENIVSYNKYK